MDFEPSLENGKKLLRLIVSLWIVSKSDQMLGDRNEKMLLGGINKKGGR